VTIPVKKMLVSSSKHDIKCPYPMDAEYITYHNTWNDATAQGEVKYMIGNNSQVSFHYAVDDKEVVQGIDVNRNAWHCGDGGKGTGNRKSIGVEVCYSKSGGAKYKKAEKLANKFIAQLLHERGWGVDRVKPHQYWSGKFCPHRILADKRWNEIIADIQAELNALKGNKKPAPAPASSRGYLDKGDTGAPVKKLQEMLKKAGYNVGTIDGIFGSKTESAVKAFQKDHKLMVDGIVGNTSLQVLEALTASKPQSKPAKKPTVSNALPNNVYGTVEVLVANLNVREKADFNSRIVKVVKKGEKYKVYAQKNGLYHLGGSQYVTANPKYVKFSKNSAYGIDKKTVEVLTPQLWVYDKADWDAKKQIVKKGEVFTIAKELTVDGAKMYQLKSGLFITANPKYVKVR
jgi:N-acetylmuramoyl-L-alanine amidase